MLSCIDMLLPSKVEFVAFERCDAILPLSVYFFDLSDSSASLLERKLTLRFSPRV